MSLGNSLFNARKKSGLSQEEVAEKLGVSRQTISKWELDETLPDIRQAKKLSSLYHLSLDELIDYDVEVEEIERAIEKTSEATQQKIDWTAVWGKKYPVLTTYRQTVAVEDYAPPAGAAGEPQEPLRLQRPGCHAGAQRHFGAGLETAVTKKGAFTPLFRYCPLCGQSTLAPQYFSGTGSPYAPGYAGAPREHGKAMLGTQGDFPDAGKSPKARHGLPPLDPAIAKFPPSLVLRCACTRAAFCHNKRPICHFKLAGKSVFYFSPSLTGVTLPAVNPWRGRGIPGDA